MFRELSHRTAKFNIEVRYFDHLDVARLSDTMPNVTLHLVSIYPLSSHKIADIYVQRSETKPLEHRSAREFTKKYPVHEHDPLTEHSNPHDHPKARRKRLHRERRAESRPHLRRHRFRGRRRHAR